MLEVKNIKKEYRGFTALDDVSLCLGEKERVSIRGESGCGKSTLLMIIAGLTEADSGQILKNGKELPLVPHKRGMSMVFQDATLWNHMTVKENILFASPFNEKKVRDIQAEELSEAFGIENLLSRYPTQISGGQAKRAAIARALAAGREILLLDEPFSNLDKVWREKTVLKTKELTEGRCSVILVTHSSEEADLFCNTHYHMEEGKFVE